jgi:regulator of cell morphogenesis and NO signaling
MPHSVQLEPEMSLGDLAGRCPAMLPWMIEQDLDFCCGGGEPLGKTAQRLGMAWPAFQALVDQRLADTSEAPCPIWLAGQEAQLIDYILVAFHHRHREDFPVIETMLAKVCRAHGSKTPMIEELARCTREMIADLELHMLKEEHILFPLIRRLCGDTSVQALCGPPTPLQPMLVMRSEHEQAGRLLEHLRSLTEGFTPPTWGCATVRALYAALADLERLLHLHIHLENNVLFPMVEARMAETAPVWRV